MSDVLETYPQRMKRIENQVLNAGDNPYPLELEDLHFLLGKAKIAELLEEENRSLRYSWSEDYVLHLKEHLRFLEKQNQMLTRENKLLREK